MIFAFYTNRCMQIMSTTPRKLSIKLIETMWFTMIYVQDEADPAGTKTCGALFNQVLLNNRLPYAPGCDVVIDGLVYKSAGITLNWHIPASDSEVKEIQSMRYIWRCHKCGASGTSTSLCDVKCDVCGSEIDTRDMQKYIQPAGFSVDFNAAVNNNVSVQRYINICEPLVTAHNTLNSYLGLPYVKYKNDKEGSVIHYSNGGGEGYILCLECGRMVANNKKNREEFKKRHYRLRSGVYIDINGLKFNDVKLETVENISYDKMFNISSEVNGPGYGFGNRLLSILASSLDKGISSPIVKIEYRDRYLKNPLASGLFYSFIKELKVRYEKLWNCASITLETAETTKTNKQYPTMFYHDWDDVDARNEVLTALFDKIELKFQLKEKNKKYLEHNRIMTIELENGEKINLILDQGFSYWRCLA